MSRDFNDRKQSEDFITTRDCPPSVIYEVIRVMDSYLLPMTCSETESSVTPLRPSTYASPGFASTSLLEAQTLPAAPQQFPTVAFRDLFCRIFPH